MSGNAANGNVDDKRLAHNKLQDPVWTTIARFLFFLAPGNRAFIAVCPHRDKSHAPTHGFYFLSFNFYFLPGAKPSAPET